ncbi:MAG: hypothetical protein AAF223_12070 [Bacteroidota bacterium]
MAAYQVNQRIGHLVDDFGALVEFFSFIYIKPLDSPFMKKPRLTVAVSAILLILTPRAYAQPGGGNRPPIGNAGFNIEEMVLRERDNLFQKIETLSDDQIFLLTGIYEEYGQTIKENFEEARKSGDMSSVRPKMLAVREEKNLLIKDVLDDEEYAQYLKLANGRQQLRNRQSND